MWLRSCKVGALIGDQRSKRRWSCAGLVLWLFVSLRVAGAVIADPIELARGIRVEVSNGAAIVSRGAVRAPLLRTPAFGYTANPASTQLEFELDTCWTFGEREQAIFTLDMLEARLENAAALKLHRARHYQEAASGFRRTLQLDPNYLLAGYNLASALRLSGQQAEAAAVLSSFLARNLARVYLAALQDPELTPLLNHPSLAALRSHPPGTATLRTWDTDWIAYSPKHGWLAVLDPHDGLRVYSHSSGKLEAVLELGDRIVRWSGDGDSFRAAEQVGKRMEKLAKQVFDRKLPGMNRFLGELGFVEVTHREIGKIEGSPNAYKDMSFPIAGMKLIFVSDSVLRLVQHERIISETDGLWGERLAKVVLLPSLKTIVWKWSRSHGATDCHRQAGTEVLVPSTAPGVGVR